MPPSLCPEKGHSSPGNRHAPAESLTHSSHSLGHRLPVPDAVADHKVSWDKIPIPREIGTYEEGRHKPKTHRVTAKTHGPSSMKITAQQKI